jgi:hypothetical protein
MMRPLMFVTGLSCAVVGTAGAEPYWIAYEGDDFPENRGWTRVFGDENGPLQGGAEREIENGIFRLDGLRSDQIFDFYEIARSLDPDAGEVFVMRWRVRVVEVVGSRGFDPAVVVFSDHRRGVAFEFGENEVSSLFESQVKATFEPGLFHSFEFRSAHMLDYELYVDGHFASAGSFVDVASMSRVNWGDSTQGAASLSEWDYVRFGVVPEPEGLALFIVACLLVRERSERCSFDRLSS